MSVREGSVSPLKDPTGTDARIPNESSSTWYLHHLDSHISSSKQHVLGQSSNVSQSAALPTIVPPSNSIWTPQEKSLFFASLRRHSRFRPDSIADELKTKSQIEVEWYLDLLESGSEVVGQVDKKRIDAGDNKARWDGGRSWRQGLAPASREVSDEWIKKEELVAEGIMSLVNEKERQDHSETTRRAKRAEKSALTKLLPEDLDWSWYEKKKRRETDPLLKATENRWAISDWSESLDEEKLSALNSLMMPDWSEWYSTRLQTRVHAGNQADTNGNPNVSGNGNSSPDPESASDSDPGSGSSSENEDATPASGVQAKISADNKNYKRFTAIPKEERSPFQRQQIAAILNRRRNREKYRTNKLLKEGMTAEEIEKAGGADAVFSSREKNANDGSTAFTNKVSNKNRSGKVLERDTRGGEEPDMVKTLKKWGMYDHVMLSGLEVFNYEVMESVMASLAPSTPPNISFAVLQHLHTQLTHFLRNTMYNAITVAELTAAQRTKEELADGDGIAEISAKHVYQSLALVGAKHPYGVVEESISRIYRDADLVSYGADEGEDGNDGDEGNEVERDKTGSIEGSGPAGAEDEDNEDAATDNAAHLRNLRRARYPAHFLTQGDVPVHLIPSFDALASATADNPLIDPRLQIQDQAQSSSRPSVEDEHSLTDEEDDDLDAALDYMDHAHDKSLEAALWRKLKDDEEDTVELDDGTDVWSSRSVRRANGKKYRARSRAEKGYIQVLLSVDAARRKRRYVERQAERYPTTRLRKTARQAGGVKSAAFIVESDDEDESDEDDLMLGDDVEEEEEDGEEDEGEEEEGEEVDCDIKEAR